MFYSELAHDESYWAQIAAGYQVAEDFINLENGYYGVLPSVVLEAQIAHTRALNATNTRFVRTQKDNLWATLKTGLSQILDCQPDHLAFTRNATESLNLLLSGIALAPGDQILASPHDYPTGIEAIRQRAAREGIGLRMVELPPPDAPDDLIVEVYQNAIGPATRLMLLTHVVHLSGRILPVARIVEMAHRHGVEVLLDSAHAFAQFPFSVREIGCDYGVANLHKWLGAPLTGGLVYIRPDKIHKVLPLLANTTTDPHDIRKLENGSAMPLPVFMTVADALDYHHQIGIGHKAARLDDLKRIWAQAARTLPGVALNMDPDRSCAIGSFSVRGWSGTASAEWLWQKHRIYTFGFDLEHLSGVRIVPQLYNSPQDMSRLVEAIEEMQTLDPRHT